MHHDQTDLKPNEKAAITMLVLAIQSHPESHEDELSMTSKLLSKYIEEPTKSTFSMAKMAFDDIEPEIKKQICANAISSAYSRAGTTKTQPSLHILTGQIGSAAKAHTKSQQASPYLAALNR